MSEKQQWFDLKSAVLGALLMAAIVGCVNASHGLESALTAGAKQAAYTFFVAGFIVQFCRWCAGFPLTPVLAIALATLIPSVLTVFFVFVLHSLKGTAEPILSTIPVAVINLFVFFILSRDVVSQRLSILQGNEGLEERNSL